MLDKGDSTYHPDSDLFSSSSFHNASDMFALWKLPS